MSEAVPINCQYQDVGSGESPSDPLLDKQDVERMADQEPLLVVDLDGTLVRVDLLHEAFFRSALQSPIKTARICLRLAEGRAAFKQALAQNTTLDAPFLPYRPAILQFLRAERSRGRTIILATASCREWAESVASHLQLFDHVIATEGTRNVKGAEKLRAIREFCQQRGFTEFEYIGDSWADLPIWQQASKAYLAMPNWMLLRELRRRGAPVEVFENDSSLVRATFRALRPHQWAKNAILFVPLIASHRISDTHLLLLAIIAFVAFSMFASSVYLLNDFVDVEHDRRHLHKRKRPFAAGDLPLTATIPLAGGLFLAGSALSYAYLPLGFLAILGIYLIATTAYSLFIKRIMIGDVMVLAGLYVLRVVAGGTACDIPISDWLLTFSLFVFVSLGFLKRYVELTRIDSDGLLLAPGRGYEVGDLSLIESMGTSSGLMAVVVLALYLQSEQVRAIYRFGRPLWILCPILMYWLCRAWILAKRRQMSHDPILFALTDVQSLIIVAVTLMLMLVSSLGGFFAW